MALNKALLKERHIHTNLLIKIYWRKNVLIIYYVTLNWVLYKQYTFNSSKNSHQVEISIKYQFTDKATG